MTRFIVGPDGTRYKVVPNALPDPQDYGWLEPVPTGFIAKPRWQRSAFRVWRLLLSRGAITQHGRETRRYIIPPREWSQDDADAAIRRGQELAEKYGW